MTLPEAVRAAMERGCGFTSPRWSEVLYVRDGRICWDNGVCINPGDPIDVPDLLASDYVLTDPIDEEESK